MRLRKMLQECAVLLGLLICASPLSAQPVQQSGSISPGHPVRWITTGVVGDGGTASQGLLTGLGVTASGPSICARSAASGASNRICLGASQTGGGVISVDNIGGGTGGFTLQLNGVTQGIATVTLPVTTNDLACFADTTGTLKDCGIGPTATPVPKITQYLNAGAGAHSVTSGTTLLQVTLVGAGGGGSGNTGSNRIAYALYGGRGGDSSFLITTPATATITIATTAVITVANHGLANSQPVYFTTTGALPTGITANTIYYVVNGSQTTDTFQISAIPYTPPGVVVQTPITTTGSQSGVQSMTAYFYTAQGGGGGGTIGDQGTPQSTINCDLTNNPVAGYQTSMAWSGAAGNNIYGDNVAGGMGGGSVFGGSAASQQLNTGNSGNNKEGGGGSGAGSTPTSQGGGGGAGGAACSIWFKPTASSYNYVVGASGTAGTQGADTATITIATPAVITIASHGFGVNTPITFTTTGSLPTGISTSTTYYIYGPSITANTFQITTSASLGANGTAVNTSGGQSGVHTVHSGYAGGAGGVGSVIITEYFGVNFLMLPDTEGVLVPANDNYYSNSKAA